MRRCWRGGAALALALSAGCSNGPVIVPAELQAFKAEHNFIVDWSTGVGEAGPRGSVRLAPYVAQERVFAVDNEGRLTCVDRASGDRIWRVELGQSITAGVSGDAEFVYAASADGSVYSLNQSDGSIKWQARVSSEVVAAPVAGAGSVVVRSIDGRVVALERATGERRWVYNYNVPPLSLHGNGRPLAVPDGYLLGLDNGRLVALSARNGRVHWETALSDGNGRSEVDRLNDLDADVRIAGEYIYAVNYQGSIARIEPASGQLIWSVPMSSTAGFAIDGERIYITDEFDTVWALQLEDGATIWKQESFGNRRLTAPTVIGNRVVVGDFEGYLHLLSGEDGSVVARRKLGSGEIMLHPINRDDTLYVQDRGGKLAALQIE